MAIALCVPLGACSAMLAASSEALSPLGAVALPGPPPNATPRCTGEDGQQVQRVLTLRKHYRGSGNEAGERELERAEAEAGTYFLCAGAALAKQERYQDAIEKYELGLVAQPTGRDLLDARQEALSHRELARLFIEAQRARSVGNYDLAETLLKQAALQDGGGVSVKKEIAKIEKDKRAVEKRATLSAFSSSVLISLNFRDAKLKDMLKVVGDSYALNFVLDKTASDLGVSISAKNVTLEQALSMVMQSAGADYKILGPNSLFIYESTPEKKKQYEDRYLRTYHLSTLKADRMAEILKASIDPKSMIANNDLGTIQIREDLATRSM